MKKYARMSRIIVIFLILVFYIGGCKKIIKYNLNPKDIHVPGKTLPLIVQVSKFSDIRDMIEKEKKARKKAKYKDLGDYTYDKEFRGEVAEEITKMTVEHLRFSNVFSRIWYDPTSSGRMSDKELDSVSQRGINTLMEGELENFYAYYDQNPLRQIFYYLGIYVPYIVLTLQERTKVNVEDFSEVDDEWVLIDVFANVIAMYAAAFFDSLNKRNIEFRVKLKTRLVDTYSHEIFWEDTFELSGKMFRSKKSIYEGKFMILDSLRDTINKMTESLQRITLPKKKEF